MLRMPWRVLLCQLDWPTVAFAQIDPLLPHKSGMFTQTESSAWYQALALSLTTGEIKDMFFAANGRHQQTIHALCAVLGSALGKGLASAALHAGLIWVWCLVTKERIAWSHVSAKQGL